MRLTTPLVLSFLLGVTAHSIFPYAYLPIIGVSFIIGACLLAVFLIPDTCYMSRVACLLLLTFTLGLYRFSLAQPSLPRNLIFADPKGLAMSVDASRTANHLDPRHWLARMRVASTIHAYERFPSDEAALLTGLLYGARDLSKSDKLAFRHAGLTHIIAVSGANMTIIVVLVMRLLLAARLSRRQAFSITILAIIAFTLFVGPSASVIRAALMGILVEMAPLVGRLIRPTRLLLISAFIFVLWRPWSLIFDPSFALSFFAMLGLLTLGRHLNRSILDTRFPILSRSTTLREIVTSTLSATAMTAPYAAWAFGNVTLWSLPTGLLVLPFIPWTMALGSGSLIFPTSSSMHLLTLPTSGLLETMLWIARVPDRLHIGFFDRTFLPFSGLCAIYSALFVLWHVTPSSSTAPSDRSDGRMPCAPTKANKKLSTTHRVSSTSVRQTYHQQD